MRKEIEDEKSGKIPPPKRFSSAEDMIKWLDS